MLFASCFRKVKKPIFVLTIIFVISFFVIEGLIILNSFTDDVIATDYVVVLGAGLFGDKPSPSLELRLRKAAEYAAKYPHIPIVVSGGQGPDEWISEAEAMSHFLVENGILATKIIKEDSSRNTNENLALTKEVLKRDTLTKRPKVLLITSEYHMFRAKFLAKRHGFIPYGICAPTPIYPGYLKPLYYLREYFAVIKSLLFDW